MWVAPFLKNEVPGRVFDSPRYAVRVVSSGFAGNHPVSGRGMDVERPDDRFGL
jgi:hypothetical protein